MKLYKYKRSLFFKVRFQGLYEIDALNGRVYFVDYLDFRREEYSL